MSYTTVLVGLDGSTAALLAVDQAARTAVSNRAALVVVCAYHPVPAREQAARTVGLADAKDRVTGTAEAQAALDAGTARARSAGHADVEGRLVMADAVEALLRVAGQTSADLIVVANRSAGALTARLLGSVASAVVHRAPCDVLVVRARGALT